MTPIDCMVRWGFSIIVSRIFVFNLFNNSIIKPKNPFLGFFSSNVKWCHPSLPMVGIEKFLNCSCTLFNNINWSCVDNFLRGFFKPFKFPIVLPYDSNPKQFFSVKRSRYFSTYFFASDQTLIIKIF